MRKHSSKPIIYTVRTVSQGGKFDDNDIEGIERLSFLGIKLGVEFLDVQLTYPTKVIDHIMENCGYTRILGSHHDFSGTLKWNSTEWETKYSQALEMGVDIVKFVGTAVDFRDNLYLETFRNEHTSKPLIAINMGEKGKLSRVLNTVFTQLLIKLFLQVLPQDN